MGPKLLAPVERDVIALRVLALPAEGRGLHLSLPQDAGGLVRRRALVGAIGIAAGTLFSDGYTHRPRADQATALPTKSGTSEFWAAPDLEDRALHELRDLLVRCTSPLLVTCGGRAFDLPFLRYRYLARNISIPVLHLQVGKRFSYFDRFDQNWHFDLADFLAGQGASQPLTLSELCDLAGVPTNSVCADMRNAAQQEAVRIFSLFFHVLQLIGSLDERPDELGSLEREVDALSMRTRS